MNQETFEHADMFFKNHSKNKHCGCVMDVRYMLR